MSDTYTLGDVEPEHWNAADKAARRAGMIPVSSLCNCGQCGRMHKSDCAVHNEPAYPKGACDCSDALEGTDK